MCVPFSFHFIYCNKFKRKVAKIMVIKVKHIKICLDGLKIYFS